MASAILYLFLLQDVYNFLTKLSVAQTKGSLFSPAAGGGNH
ncbi:hypothetical protein [Kamptonema formosum]|nr:hypothetical protein [Oscillatoria sp. PCC 10802]